MSSNHYDSLRVVPWAEDAVIQAAYRALMRVYHPDTNRDPEAHERVREITGAFAVLGDPAKRAAYDSLRIQDDDEHVILQEPLRAPGRPPPMRNLGLASIGLALVLTLGVALWTNSDQRPGPHRLRTGASETQQAIHAADLVGLLAAARNAAVNDTRPAEAIAQAVPAPAPAPRPIPMQPNSHVPAPPAPVPAPMPVARRQMAEAVVPKVAAPAPAAAAPAPVAASASSKMAGCRRGSSGNGKCTDDHQVQVERIATSFLNQSLLHADAYKRQLLLAALNRSATSRVTCRSDDCVTNSYLRQIREVTAIMQGRAPQ